MTPPRRLAVIGGGWAGLAAAVEGVQRGHAVTLFEMAARCGGRARSVEAREWVLDNGQHVMIGAYAESLRLMRVVGLDPSTALLRTPLRLADAGGGGLLMRAGAPANAFVGAVWRMRGWSVKDRLALLRTASGWMVRRFRCDPATTVEQLTAHLPASARQQLIEPLCIAALNTPANDASGAVFLRVMKDALFAGPGSADLLLPRIGLSELFAEPAARWLAERGAEVKLQRRVASLAADGEKWSVDGERFDAVVLATTPIEAARLARNFASEWSAVAAALRCEPIVTVYLRSDGARLSEPMLALQSGDDAPAQFVFDRGQLGGPSGLLAFVISGARAWVERGMEATVGATLVQAARELRAQLRAPLERVHALTDKRATFRCTPLLERPASRIARCVRAAGDYVEGPYPATLEGAVRSGRAAAVAALD